MIYLDNSATTFYKPISVINAVSNSLKYLSANPTRSSHSLAVRAGILVEETRENCAKFLGCTPDKIIYTMSCTDALNTAIFGTVKRGGHIITTALEHNSVLRPLSRLKSLGIIDYTTILPLSNGCITPEQINSAIRPNTYMVIANHVSNVTGAVNPINEIGYLCNKRGLLFLVDGAQSVGYTKVNMKNDNITMLAVAPHKGLHSPQGVGILAINSDIKIEPFRYGGTGTESAKPQPTVLPEALESGTLPTPAIAGLQAGLQWTIEEYDANRKKLNSMFFYCISELSKINSIQIYTPKDSIQNIISFNIKGISANDVGNILSDEYDICLRAGLHCAPFIHKHYGTLNRGMIRASLGVDNDINELNYFIQAIKEISKT